MPPNPAGGSTFGSSLAISGNSIVIGQHLAQVGGFSAGAAYVYQYDPGTGDVTLVTTLNNPSANDGDGFGRALALTGNSVVVGADADDTQRCRE